MSSPVLLLGLDGASWELIDEHLDVSLPTLDALRADGVEAVSESALPPVTCPNWRCVSSGKTPGQLGVYWWERIDMAERTVELVDTTAFETADVWDYAVAEGTPTGVVNMPLTHPPTDETTPFVSGGPDAEATDFTAPPDLATTLSDRFDYRVHTRTTTADPAPAVGEDVLELLEQRFETAKYLYREHDLEFVVTILYYLVRLEHYFWDDAPVREAYELIDEQLSWFVDEGFNIVIVSDHGTAEIDTIFNINEWLARNNYLSETVGTGYSTVAPMINKERLASFLAKAGLRKAVSRFTPTAVKDSVPDSPSGVQGKNKESVVDWDRTTALASGQGPLYVTDDADVDALREELLSIEGPDGRPVIDAVHRTAELYPGSGRRETAPDLIVEQRKGVHTTDSIGGGSIFESVAERGKWRAENHSDGIFLASGPDVRDDWDRDEVPTFSVMPTVLHLLGSPIPDDVRYDPLPIRRRKHDVERRDSLSAGERTVKEDDAAMEERLSDLGYLS